MKVSRFPPLSVRIVSIALLALLPSAGASDGPGKTARHPPEPHPRTTMATRVVRTGWLPSGGISAAGQHPRNAGHDWTSDLQGVTSDKTGNWYFTQARRIWKLPMRMDLDRDFSRKRSQGLAGLERRMGFDHMGDPDYFGGYIYVPMERPHARRPAAVSLRNADLKFLGIVTLCQGAHAPWVAVNPVDRQLYSSGFSGVTAVKRYPRAVSAGRLSLGSPERIPLFDERGAPLTLQAVQGGAFSPEGHLYLVTRYGIEAFDVTDGRRRLRTRVPYRPRWAWGHNLGDELEGIEFLDFDSGRVSSPGVRGQLHLVMIDNDGFAGGADDLYFKHFRVTDRSRR